MKKQIVFISAFSIFLGVLIGSFYTSYFAQPTQYASANEKMGALLQLIENNYVDTVDVNKLVEDAMPKILSQLDPHSAYIPANEVDEANEELHGSFSGIGISFKIMNDTIVVMDAIDGGPAKRVGIMAGDRIVRIDDELYVGKEVVTDTGAMHRLKGPKHTEVRLTVKRDNVDFNFTVARDDIPMHSIDCAYIIPDTNIGYIRIKSFGETTYQEMMYALVDFKTRQFSGLIIDLRGNRGGYMNSAIVMLNELLPARRLIVYAQGRAMPREDFYSNGRGSFPKIPLAVLIDEMSASASEIFAGAIQDNDRGVVIGRRSFGKGLVQQPFDFRDNSQLRLTIARYYTPSGRCIQKPYQAGRGEDYENDLIARYERGEFFSQDSIHQDGPQYKTFNNRIVYGGGGIMPDIFVPEDTALVTSYYKQVLLRGLFPLFAFNYTDKNRVQFKNCKTPDDVLRILRRDYVIDKFADFAAKNGVQRRNLLIQRSLPLFERYLYGAIIYDILNVDAYQQYLNRTDKVVMRAVNELSTL